MLVFYSTFIHWLTPVLIWSLLYIVLLLTPVSSFLERCCSVLFFFHFYNYFIVITFLFFKLWRIKYIQEFLLIIFLLNYAKTIPFVQRPSQIFVIHEVSIYIDKAIFYGCLTFLPYKLVADSISNSSVLCLISRFRVVIGQSLLIRQKINLAQLVLNDALGHKRAFLWQNGQFDTFECSDCNIVCLTKRFILPLQKFILLWKHFITFSFDSHFAKFVRHRGFDIQNPVI